MDKAINEFIERSQQLARRSNVLAAGITGGSNRQSIMIDLYKSASLLLKANSENKLAEQINQVAGVLQIAEAMNVIAHNDFVELMELLEKIDRE